MSFFKNNFVQQKINALPKDFWLFAYSSPLIAWSCAALCRDYRTSQKRLSLLSDTQKKALLEDAERNNHRSFDAISAIGERMCGK